jgi:hypothetical protein
MKTFRSKLISVACALASVTLLGNAVVAQEKSDHPGTVGEDVRYRGAPAMQPEVKQVTSPGAPPVTEAEFARATKI